MTKNLMVAFKRVNFLVYVAKTQNVKVTIKKLITNISVSRNKVTFQKIYVFVLGITLGIHGAS